MFLKFYTITPLKFSWKNQTLWLSAKRCLFWEEEKILIISDPHFGKTGHFRKAGISVPQKAFQNDLHRLFESIEFFRPETLLIDGDLFHSSYNREVDYFFRWRNNVSDLEIILVKGNHDRFSDDVYGKANIRVCPVVYTRYPFCFVHDIESVDNELYAFSGHIHPSVRLSGMGRQSVTLPCFYFGNHYSILPAFGNFTGSFPIDSNPDDVVFCFTDEEVLRIS